MMFLYNLIFNKSKKNFLILKITKKYNEIE
jgi:hypothetical protein